MPDPTQTPVDRTVLASGPYLDPLAEYLMLTGLKIGRGDLYRAMAALGLALRPAAEITPPPEDESWTPRCEAIGAVFDQLTEDDVCPKCGCLRRRLRGQPLGAGGGWWHQRETEEFGWQRRCISPDMRGDFRAGDSDTAGTRP